MCGLVKGWKGPKILGLSFFSGGQEAGEGGDQKSCMSIKAKVCNHVNLRKTAIDKKHGAQNFKISAIGLCMLFMKNRKLHLLHSSNFIRKLEFFSDKNLTNCVVNN